MPSLTLPWWRSVDRPARVASVFVLLVCASILLIEAWRIDGARRAQIAETEIASGNLAKSVAEMTTATLMQADVVLSGLVERLETDGLGPSNVDRIHRLLRARKLELPQLQRLSIIGADGHWVTTDLDDLDRRVDHSDREYIRHHRAHADRAPFLGPPIRARSTGEWIITMSRRFDDADGRFAGVALASISLSWFNAYFEQLDIGRNGAILLATSDGTVIDRRPFLEDAIGTSLADGPLYREHIAYDNQGTAWITSRFDGVERLLSFHKAERLPLYAIAALSKDEVLAAWIQDTIVHGGAALTLVAILAVIGGRLIASIARRHRDHRLLAESRAELLAANAKLEEVAREDGLTGLANRRAFDRALDEEALRAARARGSLALLMLDVDCFKAYNDAYGHPAGDACLRHIATDLRAEASRPGDLAARYGGEEFVVLLPGTDVAGAVTVARNIRASLHAAAIAHDRSPFGIVTASIGIASETGVTSDFDPFTLVERADRALYAAKNAGRDAIRTADDEGLVVPVPVKAASRPATRPSELVSAV